MRRSEEGRWKRTRNGTSLAAYPTARPVWGKEVEKGPTRHLVGFPSYIYAVWVQHGRYETAIFEAAQLTHHQRAA